MNRTGWLTAAFATFGLGVMIAGPARAECIYAGTPYSAGATVCECPKVDAENLYSTNPGGFISARRLECGADGAWKAVEPSCMGIGFHGNLGISDLYLNMLKQICPSLKEPQGRPSGFEISADAALDQMTDDELKAAAMALCRRNPRIGPACQTIIDAFERPKNER